MASESLKQSDGRWKMALPAVQKILALGLTAKDVAQLMKWFGRVVRKQKLEDIGLQADRAERCRLGQWAIRLLLALGFSESEIAAHLNVSHTAITRALDPRDPRVLSPSNLGRLLDTVKGAGAERFARLLPPEAIRVLDTCSDAGHTIDGAQSAQMGKNAQTHLLNALFFASAPVPLLQGVHAYMAQVGDPVHGLFLIKVPADFSNEPERGVTHWRMLEHEIQHLQDRVRAKRKKAEQAHRKSRKPPIDGNIA